MSMIMVRLNAIKVFLYGVLAGFAMLPASGYATDAIPKDVLEQIEAQAIWDFPDDIKMRKEEVRNQVAAYRRIRDYKHEKVPPEVLKTIKMQASLYAHYDYLNQLFLINKQVNSYIKMGILSSRSYISEMVDCKFLRWRLTVKGSPAIYRGTVKAGSADVIHVEVRSKDRIIAQDFGFPNPRGAWEIILWGDYKIAEKHKETFY